jgi:hypothetical protein
MELINTQRYYSEEVKAYIIEDTVEDIDALFFYRENIGKKPYRGVGCKGEINNITSLLDEAEIKYHNWLIAKHEKQTGDAAYGEYKLLSAFCRLYHELNSEYNMNITYKIICKVNNRAVATYLLDGPAFIYKNHIVLKGEWKHDNKEGSTPDKLRNHLLDSNAFFDHNVYGNFEPSLHCLTGFGYCMKFASIAKSLNYDVNHISNKSCSTYIKPHADDIDVYSIAKELITTAIRKVNNYELQ